MNNSILYLDIGNTFAKWKFQNKYFSNLTSEFDFNKLQKVSKVLVSNVYSKEIDFLNANIQSVQASKTYKSLINAYKEPKHLGADRWLAMIACYEKKLNTSFLIIDIGTAVTFDLVDKTGVHKGGLIFPGLDRVRSSFLAFHANTNHGLFSLGKNTEDAWSLGTLSLVYNGINQNVQYLQSKNPDLMIYITGGGFYELKDFLNFSYTYEKNLVLDGLELFANNVG